MRTVMRGEGVELLLDGKRVVDFSSNDYLGLAGDPRIARAAAEALGTGSTGATAARLISGTQAAHVELEREIARFKGAEAALLFPSGYAANTGTIQAIVGRRDVIYADQLNHASLIDGARLSRAEIRVFPHVDLTALRAMLKADAGNFRRRLIVVDGVFSMDGDMFPLGELVSIAREFQAWTYVDDAHATGVLGANGRGSAEHCGVEGEIDVLMGTLGKAIGTVGAFTCGSRVLIDYLIHRARSFIFTTASPPALAAATLEALRIVSAEPGRRSGLRRNAHYLRKGLRETGHSPMGDDDGYIVPIMLGESERATSVGNALREAGYLVGAVRPPTVPMGQSRLRITVSAAHNTDHIDGLISAIGAVLN
ncbi:MAG TPA: 8-amino-7-oxononanoate synthase [Gemmatimonadaceae bacterium]|nr:8-amino-7-oxononanoate synthase [Gemmatimonadaceae bacterium]